MATGSEARRVRGSGGNRGAQLENEREERGVAEVMVSLASPSRAMTAPAMAMAAGAGGGGTAASVGFPSVAREFSYAGLPHGLISCFESEYKESNEAGGLSLSMTAPRDRTARSAKASLYSGQEIAPLLHLNNLGMILGSVSSRGLRELHRHQLVRSVRAVPEMTLVRPRRLAQAEPATEITWGIKHLTIRKLRDQGLQGEGITVAHLDTGADGTHPMPKDAFAAFAEFNYIGRPVVPEPAPHDTDRHGTHTAGTIAGREVQGHRMGVAPKVKLASAIVIEGGRVTFRILSGINWALQQGAKVLSMSLGLPGVVDDFAGISQTLRDRGMLLIVAIGNEGPGTSRSPGNYRTALSVGAANEQGEVADFSSSQGLPPPRDRIVPDLVGAGVGVISSVPGGGYLSMDGTSMPTTHIGALAALLFEAKPTATPDQVQNAIFNSCQRTKQMKRDRANRGLPDAEVALKNL